ncbi:unnamed protein product [Allacma fusca]|uniref:Anaphase-promoting complex subunit 5 n=1 Tax=Allacma fusca TaxID=39272 RepID=A0A8J2L6E0_9HEXA|nr:unnamed protein product [Allacma fusca]
MQANSEAPRQDKCWRVLREGEVSPFKIVTVIFIRESYIHVELRRGSPEERCATVRLMHDLITSHDMSFPEFKAVIEDPKNSVRPEILKRFNKVLLNLEEVNASFLYELVHSVIDVETTQTNILRKRITKSSPFGKFLRVVLLNLRKMSYPQALYLFQQLCGYLHPTIEFKRPCWLSRSAFQSVDTVKIKTETPVVIKREVEDFQENIPVAQSSSVAPAEKPESSKSFQSHSTSKSGKPDKRRKKGLDIFLNLTQNRKKNGLIGLSMNVKAQYEHEKKRYQGLILPQEEETYCDTLHLRKEKIQRTLEAVKNLRMSWNPESTISKKLDFSSLESSPETSFQPKRQRQRSTPKKIVKSPRKAKSLPNEISVAADDDSDYFLSETESAGKEAAITPTKRGTRSSSSATTNLTSKGVKLSEKDKKSTELKRKISLSDLAMEARRKPKNLEKPELVVASKRWANVKYWSRKQIEKTIKLLAADLYHARGRVYLPADVSTFVEAIKYNPSAQVLLPQLHYLEYLNCLRLKDIMRCTESLRTSFDLRIKPNTSELNKGTPYAAYNFAVFYRLLGFEKDSMLFLEEAFQAGHSAADATCLHYCHNLWSTFLEKPYTEAIVTVTKEVDKHMAYLHSLNVLANAYEYQFQGLPPEEIIYAIWHYNACDIEEVESVLLLSLGSFFAVFGWHDLIAFACQTILYSELRWPTRSFCGALCLFAQCVLLEGDTELALEMMRYGDKIFGLDSSAAGQLFGRQHGLFKALFSFLGHKPVPDEVVLCIAAYDDDEELFWRAYNKMIQNHFEEAEILLWRLQEKHFGKSSSKRELKLRCLLLQAELKGLSGKPTTALKHLFEALELASSVYSDHYISLCLTDIASIQCDLGLVKTASRTIFQELRSTSRSSCPIVTAKLNLVTMKLRLACAAPISLNNQKYYLILLEESRKIFQRWDNSYRLSQVSYLKEKLQERCDGMDCASNGVTYLNLYEFQCAKRFCFTDLELQHPGMCRSPKITAKVKKLQNFVKPKKMKKCEVDDCLCDYGYFPVCGSNGITYGNACILNCSKICIPGLQQIHLGPCAASIIFRDNIPNKYFTYTFNSSNLRLLFDTIRSCLTSDRN